MIAIAERKILRLSVMTALYVAQGIPYGFITVTLSAFLAKQPGIDAGDIGDLTAFAMLPWSFKWLWAPLVDRFSSSQMGRRRPWIIAAQLVLVTMMSALIFVPDVSGELETVRWMVFVASVFASLQDVSVDALAIDLLPEKERGFANGLMYGGSYLGVILGGAGLSTIAGETNLSGAMVAQAMMLGGIALLPLLLRERATDKWMSLRTRPRPVDRPRTNLFVNLAKAFGRRSPLVAAFLAVGILVASQTLTAVLTVLLMKRLGWEQAEFGQMTGGWPLIFGLSGSIVGGWLADKIGHKTMVAIASVALGCVFITFGQAESYWPDKDFIRLYMCAREVCYGTLSAALFALLMGVSWPAVAASQFTAYMALLNLGRTIGSKLAGPLTDDLGTSGTFLSLGIWQLCVIGLLLLIDPNQNRRELGEGDDRVK